MAPLLIANALSARRRGDFSRITVAPLVPDEVVVLLAPHHSGESLTLDVAEIFAHGKRVDTVVEVIGLGTTLLDHIVQNFFVDKLFLLAGNPETDDGTLTRRNSLTFVEGIPRGKLGT